MHLNYGSPLLSYSFCISRVPSSPHSYKDDEDQELNLSMHIHLDLSERYLCSPITLVYLTSALLTAPEGKSDEIPAFILEMAGAGDSAVYPRKSVEGIDFLV